MESHLDNSPIASTIAMIVPFGVVSLASAFTRAPGADLISRAFDGIVRAPRASGTG